jgi:aminoglycoside phosphotransferase (APT) family kinase protein
MSRTPLPDLGAVNAQPLAGGVSGAAVWRAELNGRVVVIKRTDPLELIALLLIADPAEPVVPKVIMTGEDDHGPWIVTPFHSGPPAGIIAGLPLEVHHYLGRMHARFATAADLPPEFERLSDEFTARTLTEFAPAHLQLARDVIGERLHRRATDLLQTLAADRPFRTAHRLFDQTLLHGDLYGLNVMLPGPEDPHPLIIDWNATRVGPAMFDVAMTADYDSAERRAHDDGWAEVSGHRPEPWCSRTSHAWAATLINIGYAAVVAQRHSAAEAEKMINTAEDSYARFTDLLAGRRPPG